MDVLLGLLILIAIFATPSIIAYAIKAHAAQKDAELQLKHPELWQRKELVKLEKERLEMQKKLAEDRAKQEADDRNASILIGIGRGLGWW